MKHLFLIFLFIPLLANAQKDTSTFRSYNNVYSITPEVHKNVKWINNNFEIMVILGDSIYNTMSNEQLERKIRNGDYEFSIINSNDSIQKIIMSRIKSIMVLKKRK